MNDCSLRLDTGSLDTDGSTTQKICQAYIKIEKSLANVEANKNCRWSIQKMSKAQTNDAMDKNKKKIE